MNQLPLDVRIAKFLDGRPHAVIGASANREKYGNRVLRAYEQAGRPVIPVNPRDSLIEGMTTYPSLRAIPQAIHGISIVTPPSVTKMVVREAIDLGVRNIWIQPGAVDDEAVALAL